MENKKSSGWKWFFVIMFLIVLGVLSMILAGILSAFSGGSYVYSSGSGNVAVISIDGEIMTERSGGLFSSQSASSRDIVALIQEASSDKRIKALIIEIDSPGGSPFASDEIAQAIKESNKTSVAIIRSMGASGAYWVAVSTNHIIANRMSMTGSIGVYSSYLQFSGLMHDYNVTYERIVSGEYKDMGSPYKNLTINERRAWQSKIDKINQFFIEHVAEGRNMSVDDVKPLATGMVYLGSEAKELKLIDEIGGEKEAKAYLQKKLNVTEVNLVYYETRHSIFDSLYSSMNQQSYNVGRGIGDSITAKAESQRFEVRS